MENIKSIRSKKEKIHDNDNIRSIICNIYVYYYIMGLGIIAVVVILSVLLVASGGGVSHDVPYVPEPPREE